MVHSGATNHSTAIIGTANNRRFFIATIGRSISGNAVGHTAISVGGVPLDLMHSSDQTLIPGNSRSVFVQLWSATEEKILSMSGLSISYSGSSNSPTQSTVQWVVGNASQGPLVSDMLSSDSMTRNLSMPFSRVEDDLTFTIAAASDNNFGNISISNPTHTGQVIEGAAIAWGSEAAITETVDVATDYATIRHQSVVAVNVGFATGSIISVLDDVNVSPAPDKQFVTISGADNSESSLLFGASPPAVDGDQIEVPLLTNEGKSISIDPSGQVTIVNIGTEAQTFPFRIYDQDAIGTHWSEYSTATITPETIAPETQVGSASGTLRNAQGNAPADMTGLTMNLYATAEDLQNNSNILEIITDISVTSGAFSISAEIGSKYMRLFNPLNYLEHAHGPITIA